MKAKDCWAQDVFTCTPAHGLMDTRYHQVNVLIQLLEVGSPREVHPTSRVEVLIAQRSHPTSFNTQNDFDAYSPVLGPALPFPSLSSRSSTEPDNVTNHHGKTPWYGASRPFVRGSEPEDDFVLLSVSRTSAAFQALPSESRHCADANFECTAEDLAAARSMWAPISKRDGKAKFQLCAGRTMHAWSIGAVSLDSPNVAPMDACACHFDKNKTREEHLAALSRALEPRDFSPRMLKHALQAAGIK